MASREQNKNGSHNMKTEKNGNDTVVIAEQKEELEDSPQRNKMQSLDPQALEGLNQIKDKVLEKDGLSNEITEECKIQNNEE